MSLRVIIAAAEVAPFARVGGLSDVAGSLAKEVAGLGHEVALFVPKYRSIDASRFPMEAVGQKGILAVPMGGREERVELFRGGMPGSDSVTVYFVGHEPSFGREGIYVDPGTGEGYPDEVERYALFSRSIVESIRALDLRPDTVHLNDHHTALVAAFLRELYTDDPAIGTPGVLFSIHNLGYQGEFDKSLLSRIGLREDLCVPGSAFEFHGRVNSLKIGIELADYVNTVSERYAEEISSLPEYGLGMEGNLAARRDAGRLVGILNGVDYSVWDPSVDRLIPARFTADQLKGKSKCKRSLLKRCGLSKDLSIPVIGMVTRLADQKGLDLIAEKAEAIVDAGARIVVLGTGQQEYHEFLSALEARHPESVSANLTFDNELAHWIEAGSDMFLMPSRYEPCGLNQMYSLRYGTVPVVRATGGLADTVTDYDPDSDSGTGFVFDDYTAEAMESAITRALAAYSDGDAWIRLMKRGMALDFSWGTSARKYVGLYERARDAAGASR